MFFVLRVFKFLKSKYEAENKGLDLKNKLDILKGDLFEKFGFIMFGVGNKESLSSDENALYYKLFVTYIENKMEEEIKKLLKSIFKAT